MVHHLRIGSANAAPTPELTLQMALEEQPAFMRCANDNCASVLDCGQMPKSDPGRHLPAPPDGPAPAVGHQMHMSCVDYVPRQRFVGNGNAPSSANPT